LGRRIFGRTFHAATSGVGHSAHRHKHDQRRTRARRRA
jgi:hypothetical protein